MNFQSRVRSSLLRLLPQSLVGRLRMWRIRNLIRTYKSRVVEHVYGGTRLRILLADPLAEGWYDNDWPAQPEIEFLARSRLRVGAIVFDIGAHQGVVAAMLAQKVGTSGRIVAVEGSKHNCDVASHNKQLNEIPQIEVLHAVVSNKPGVADFSDGLNGQLDDGSGSSGRVSVTAITIDSLSEKYGVPDVVFLDVEGAEQLALEGARNVLETGADFFVEVHVNVGLEKLGGSVEKLLLNFSPDRYELFIKSALDETFHKLVADDSAVRERFFLVAISNKRSSIG